MNGLDYATKLCCGGMWHFGGGLECAELRGSWTIAVNNSERFQRPPVMGNTPAASLKIQVIDDTAEVADLIAEFVRRL